MGTRLSSDSIITSLSTEHWKPVRDNMISGTYSSKPQNGSQSNLPPLFFWILPLVISGLRGLPYALTHLLAPPAGRDYLKLGYIPKDFLQYQSFIRQAGESGSWILANPFTTDPQSGTFFVPFFGALGFVSKLSSIDPMLVFEAARVGLLFLLFAVLWSFLRPWFPDERRRVHACILLALAGGIEGFLKPVSDFLPAQATSEFMHATWQAHGWTLFSASYNSLWVAGLVGMLIILRPILSERGPESPADYIAIGPGFLALNYIHPYSAIGAFAIVATLLTFECLLYDRVNWRKWRRILFTLLPFVVAILLISYWQTRDPVFAAAAMSLFGNQSLAPFWYPLTYGAVILFVVRGARFWIEWPAHLRTALAAWVAAVVLLHTSPIMNGYHFIYQLYIPLCIAAAPAFSNFIDRIRSGKTQRYIGLIVFAALFSSPILLTIESIRSIRTENTMPASSVQMINELDDLPSGNVLTNPALGNAIPAYTPHRVWVGHHFLTPEYYQRSRAYPALVSKSANNDALVQIVNSHNITYIVDTAANEANIRAALGNAVDTTIRKNDAVLFVLK